MGEIFEVYRIDKANSKAWVVFSGSKNNWVGGGGKKYSSSEYELVDEAGNGIYNKIIETVTDMDCKTASATECCWPEDCCVAAKNSYRYYLWNDTAGSFVEAKDGNSTAADNYSGTYSYYKEYENGRSESGDLTINQTSNNEITFDLSVMNTQLHLGDIDNGKAKLNGNIAIYENSEFNGETCKLEIVFTKDSATIKSVGTGTCDSSCGFGMNVCADGVYAKEAWSTPADYLKFAGYVPAGWKIRSKVEGDLNKDGINDAALVVEDAVEDGASIDWEYCADLRCGCTKQNCARKLIILFGKKEGGYELSLESDKAASLTRGREVFDDAFIGLGLNNGSILLRFNSFSYGDSLNRDSSYRFRYQDGGWYLIGKTVDTSVVECFSQAFQTVDANYLTGKTETTTGDGWAEGGRVKDGFTCDPFLMLKTGTHVWTDNGIKDLINLNNFDPRIN